MSEKDAKDPDYYQELVHKLVTGTITPEEKQLLEQWYNEDQDSPIEIPASFVANETEHEKRLLARIRQKAELDRREAPVHRMRVLKTYRWWAAAAAVLLLISMATYFSNSKHDSRSKYALTDSTTYQIVSTSTGEIKKVVLPDGSLVWLNSASSIRYPNTFNDKERVVDLSGQAWFDVQHADQVPFLVHSASFTTSVMGTAFDIKDYPGEKDQMVSVQRGKVKVQAGANLLATLEKGKQVKVISGKVHQQSIDTSGIGGWKQGNLVYADETLGAIAADLQRVFKDSIQIKNTALKDVRTTGVFNKRTGMQQILAIICNITDSHLSKKNGIFIIE
jgi:ferric-dicitrate binding protein FerR (iron transport regulator)